MIPPRTHLRRALPVTLSAVLAAGAVQCTALYVSAVDLVPVSDSGGSVDDVGLPVDASGGNRQDGGGSSTSDGGSASSGSSSGGTNPAGTNPDGMPSPPTSAVPCGGGANFCYAPTMTCCTVPAGMGPRGGGGFMSSCASSPSACPAGTTTTASCANNATCGGGQVCCASGGGRGGFAGAATCQVPGPTGGCPMGGQVCTNNSNCTQPETCQPAALFGGGGGGGGFMTCQLPACTAAGGPSPCPSSQVCCAAGGMSTCQMGTTCAMGEPLCATTADCATPLVCLSEGGRGGGGGTMVCRMPLVDAGGGG